MKPGSVESLLANHPAPWTAWWVRSVRQYKLLDTNGATIGMVTDKIPAQGIARLVNDIARGKAANMPLARVIQLVASRTAEAPPAPDPLNGVAATWAELFDHLIYLLDEGDLDTLRRRLFDYARVTVDEPLPSTFTGSDTNPGDHHA